MPAQGMVARIIEPASKLDPLRVLEEAGVTPVSYRTLKRSLPVYAEDVAGCNDGDGNLAIGLLAGTVDEFDSPVPLADAVGQVGDGQGDGPPWHGQRRSRLGRSKCNTVPISMALTGVSHLVGQSGATPDTA